MKEISVGSIIVGVSGRQLLVDRVDGNIIYSGEIKIKVSAVVQVIPPVPSFKLGDRASYTRPNRSGIHRDLPPQIGIVRDIREQITPKGTHFVQCLLYFGDECGWYDSLLLKFENSKEIIDCDYF